MPLICALLPPQHRAHTRPITVSCFPSPPVFSRKLLSCASSRFFGLYHCVGLGFFFRPIPDSHSRNILIDPYEHGLIPRSIEHQNTYNTQVLGLINNASKCRGFPSFRLVHCNIPGLQRLHITSAPRGNRRSRFYSARRPSCFSKRNTGHFRTSAYTKDHSSDL